MMPMGGLRVDVQVVEDEVADPSEPGGAGPARRAGRSAQPGSAKAAATARSAKPDAVGLASVVVAAVHEAEEQVHVGREGRPDDDQQPRRGPKLDRRRARRHDVERSSPAAAWPAATAMSGRGLG